MWSLRRWVRVKRSIPDFGELSLVSRSSLRPVPTYTPNRDRQPHNPSEPSSRQLYQLPLAFRNPPLLLPGLERVEERRPTGAVQVPGDRDEEATVALLATLKRRPDLVRTIKGLRVQPTVAPRPGESKWWPPLDAASAKILQLFKVCSWTEELCMFNVVGFRLSWIHHLQRKSSLDSAALPLSARVSAC